MIIDTFLETTGTRLPTAVEIIQVCEDIGITFKVKDDGKPAITINQDNRAEGLLLAKLLRREPWRSQVMQEKGLDAKPEPIAEPEPADVPQLAIVADEGGESRRRCFAMLSDGKPFEVKGRAAVPADATAWCFEGDKRWTPIFNGDAPKLFTPEEGDA